MRAKNYESISDQIVYISRIPEGVQSKDIDGIFSAFGKIKFCKLKIDNQHKSLDKALVIYEEPKSCVKAI